MRSSLIIGIIVIPTLLQGCGHKGPLMLPAPPAQTSPAQTTNQQKPALPVPQQNPSTN